MKSRWVWLAATAVAGSALASACADNNASLFIRGNLLVQPPSCTVRADPSSTTVLSAQLDVAFSLEYTAALLIGNQMTPRGQKTRLRAETMRITLRGAEVTLTDLSGAEIAPPFSVPGSGTVDPNSSETPGYGLMSTKVIPSSIGDKLLQKLRAQGPRSTQTVVANIRVFGDTLGNEAVDSSEFTLPIKVCYGCSVEFPFAFLTPYVPGSSTPPPGVTPTDYICNNAGATTTTTSSCTPGQDSFVYCIDCAQVTPQVCLFAPQL